MGNPNEAGEVIRHYTPSVKLAIIHAIDSGEIPIAEACERHNLSLEELADWRRLAEIGPKALRSTYCQSYRPTKGVRYARRRGRKLTLPP